MSVSEVNNLKSDILYGSSHCSCGSCDSILCFTKRNIKPKECRCDLCKEPSSCMYFTKNDSLTDSYIQSIKRPKDPIPDHGVQSDTPNRVKSSSQISYKKCLKNSSSSDVKVIKKNVTVQKLPQQIWDTTIQYRNENNQSLNRNDDSSPLANIVNKLLTTYNEISVQDIVDKIKGMYSACSLRVCECVTKEDNFCKCKPCECVDCKFFSNRSSYCALKDSSYNNRTKPYSEQTCDCKPCDCEKCKMYIFKINDKGESFIIKKTIFNDKSTYRDKLYDDEKRESDRCSCKPCECSECHSMFKIHNNVVVGSVEYLQRNDCSCLPCNCSHCRQSMPATPNSMREISTDMVDSANCQCDLCLNHSCRETTEPCRCESRNSVINKPFIRDNHNIDIHSALVTKKSYYDQNNQACTVSIKIVNGYENKEPERETSDCINNGSFMSICKYEKEDSTSKILPVCPKASVSASCIKKRKITNCQCDPCECKICEKHKTNDNTVWKSVKFRSKCNCETCHCLYCSALLEPEIMTAKEKNKQASINLTRTGFKTSVNDNRLKFPPLISGYTSYTTKKNQQTCTNLQNFLLHDEEFLNRGRSLSGTKNSSLQLPSAAASETFDFNVNNYQLHLPNSYFCTLPKMTRKNTDTRSVVRSPYVEAFVKEIMQIDEFGAFNYNLKKVPSKNHPVKDINDNSLVSMWSFPELIKTNSRNSSNNIITTKIVRNFKELPVNDNIEYPQSAKAPKQNAVLKKRKDLNEPCVFCEMSTYYKENSKIENNEGAQIVRQCFAKTNLASMRSIKKTDEDSKENDFENGEINNDSIKITNESNQNKNKSKLMNIDIFVEDSNNEKPKADPIIAKTMEINENSIKSYNDYFDERNILFKAKLLTSELLKMLYKYQKANKEFESVANKFTNILDSNQQNKDSLAVPRQGSITNISFKYSWSRLACLNKNQILDNSQSYRKNSDTSRKRNEITIQSNLDTSNNCLKEKKDFSLIFCKISSKALLEANSNEKNGNPILHKQSRTNEHFTNYNNVSCNNEESIKSVIDDKRFSIIESILENFGQDEKLSKIEDYRQDDEVYLAPLENDNKNEIRLTNKELVLPERHGEIKQVIDSIYEQICSEIDTNDCLFDLQPDNKRLSCGLDHYKVNSLSLRKISNHSVLIKWEKPRNMSGVQGYKLFVDGRMVKKIYKPDSTMAVVTCLPRNERIVFTIQTLTEPSTGHHSEASMVYCQRKKENIMS